MMLVRLHNISTMRLVRCAVGSHLLTGRRGWRGPVWSDRRSHWFIGPVEETMVSGCVVNSTIETYHSGTELGFLETLWTIKARIRMVAD